jgi:hypothetical protein
VVLRSAKSSAASVAFPSQISGASKGGMYAAVSARRMWVGKTQRRGDVRRQSSQKKQTKKESIRQHACGLKAHRPRGRVHGPERQPRPKRCHAQPPPHRTQQFSLVLLRSLSLAPPPERQIEALLMPRRPRRSQESAGHKPVSKPHTYNAPSWADRARGPHMQSLDQRCRPMS